MTEPETAAEVAEEVAPPELPITFEGREIYVRMPRPEQILVWQRTVDRLTKVPAGTPWNGSEVMAALERCRKIVDSLIVNQADVNWLDDQFLEGTLSFKELTPFITQAAGAFADAAARTGNRETRRTAAKAKKAGRKVAAR